MWWDKASARKVTEFMNTHQERVERGRVLFLVEMANYLRRSIQKTAPTIKIGDQDLDYAKGLKIALIEGVDDMDALSIYHDEVVAKMSEDKLSQSALFFRKHGSSPGWVDTLIAYGPWPAYLVPVKVSQREAKIISRNARQDELQALERRIFQNRSAIAEELNRLGASGVELRPNRMAAGVEVHEDIGYNVLRVELGYEGDRMVAHWRPALRATVNRGNEVLQKLFLYLQNGNEGIFDLPQDAEEMIQRVKAEKLVAGVFQRELSPFVPKR